MKAFAALLLLVYLPGSSEVDTRGVLPKWCFDTGIEQPFMGRFWYTLPNSTNDCSKVLLFRESDFEYESASCKPLRVRFWDSYSPHRTSSGVTQYAKVKASCDGKVRTFKFTRYKHSLDVEEKK